MSSPPESPKMAEDSALPMTDVSKSSYLAPTDDTQTKITHLTPPSSSLTTSSGQTARDVQFAVSNETLRDDYEYGYGYGGISVTPRPRNNRSSYYEVHCRPNRTNSNEKDSGWRRVVQNFTPSWFSVTMGTGIVSTLLNALPYNGQWLQWISIVIFALNVVLFICGCILSIIRYIMYPQTFKAALLHPVQSMFLGAFPLGLATIINMFCFVCVPAWGNWAMNLAWALWIFDAVISVLCALSLPFLLYVPGYAYLFPHFSFVSRTELTKHDSMLSENDTDLSSMTAVWLMPIVTCVVTSGTGAIVADVLTNASQAFATVIASYILWGIGVPLSMMVFVIYFHRLTIYKLPPKETIVSVFLPMGPLGSGSFSIVKLGLTSRNIFIKSDILSDKSAISAIYVLGFMTALILWAFGLVWLFFASASILRCKKFPFNIGWWGFTFPLGAYALATCQLGWEMPSRFFKVLGTIISLCVVILWIVVSVGTLRGTISGKLLVDPSLAEMKDRQERKRLSAFL